MAETDATLPVLGVAVAILAWGSFTAPMKSPAVVRTNLDPVLFQTYMSTGICASSLALLALPGVEWAWTWWAVLSAALWAPACMLCVLCVRDLGIAVGQGAWSGCVALVSFLWGQLYFRQGMSNPVLGCFGLALLVLGIFGLATGPALCSRAGRVAGEEVGGEGGSSGEGCDAVSGVSAGSGKGLSPQRRGEAALLEGSGTGGPPLAAARELEVVLGGGECTGEAGAPGGGARHVPSRLRGVLLAVVIGFGAGSTLVPQRFTPREPFRDGVHAMTFAVCFGVAVLPVTLAIVAAYLGLYSARGWPLPRPELRTCLLPALASGVLWNAGQVGAVLAVLPPLGLTVGMPSTQACLLVSGLWGIFAFREVPSTRATIAFFAAAVVLVSGAALLGVYGAERS